VLLLGVTTSPQIVHEMLPGPALTRLSTERFELPSAAANLEQLVARLFIARPHGLRLGARSFGYLVDTYLCQHVSIRQLERALQVRRSQRAPLASASMATALTCSGAGCARPRARSMR